MTTETIDIRIREDGSRVVRRNLEEVGNGARRGAEGVDILKRALGFLAGALAIGKIIQWTDAWSRASGLIAVSTRNVSEAAMVQDELFKAAQKTRTQYSAMAELYSRVARSGKELGVSQKEILDFTEGVGKSLAVQGVSATAASGALMQMGQALGSGVVRAEEFNSMNEATPLILQTVANNMDGMGGSVAKLRQKMIDGKLTSREFFDAFMKGQGDLTTDFEKMSMTFGQSWTVIENGLTRYFGKLNESLGISKAFGTVAKWIAENLDLVGVVLASIGIALAIAFAPTVITTFMTAVKSLFTLMMAHPFGMLAAAIGFAVMYVMQFGDEMNAGIDKTTSLKDVMRAFGEEAVRVWQGIKTAASEFFSWLGGVARSAYAAVTQATEQAADSWASTYANFYDGVGTGFAGVVRAIARTVDAIAGLLTGLGIAVVRIFAGLPEAVTTPFAQMYNVAVGWVEKLINATINGVNKLREMVGKDLIDTVQLQRAEVNESYYQEYGQTIAASINDGFAQQGGFMENWVNGIFDRAQAIGKDRLKAGSGAGANLDEKIGKGNGGIDPKALEAEQKALEKLRNELNQLVSMLDPVKGAQMELADATLTLNSALGKGLITADQHAGYMAKLQAAYRDALDPLGALNRSLDEQTRLLALNSQQQAVESQLLQYSQQLRQQGVTLTEAEVNALRDKLTAIQDLANVVREQDALLSGSVGARQQFVDQIAAIQNLLADSGSGFQATDAIGAMASSMPELFAGTQELLDLQVAQFADMYGQIEMLRQADIISQQTADQMNAKVAVQANQLRLQNAQTFFDGMSVLAESGNKKVAAVGRAAAITQATIDGVLAVQKALASAPPPANYAMAAAAGVTAAANVAKIAGLGFMTGGEFTVGGSGGADSQMVAFRATPGEKVAVSTPTQVRKGDPNGSGGQQQAAPQLNQRIVNVVDPAMVGDFLATAEGEQVLINVIHRNADSLGIK